MCHHATSGVEYGRRGAHCALGNADERLPLGGGLVRYHDARPRCRAHRDVERPASARPRRGGRLLHRHPLDKRRHPTGNAATVPRRPRAAHRGDHAPHSGSRGKPIQAPHLPTSVFKLAVQKAGAMSGETALILAFKANERQSRDKYRRMAEAATISRSPRCYRARPMTRSATTTGR